MGYAAKNGTPVHRDRLRHEKLTFKWELKGPETFTFPEDPQKVNSQHLDRHVFRDLSTGEYELVLTVRSDDNGEANTDRIKIKIN